MLKGVSGRQPRGRYCNEAARKVIVVESQLEGGAEKGKGQDRTERQRG